MSALQWAGAIAGIIGAVATVYFSIVSLKDRRSKDYIGQLEDVRDEQAARIKELEHQCDQLQNENLRLMRKVMSLQNGPSTTTR